MGLNLGATSVLKMYLGGTQLSAVYLGVQSLLSQTIVGFAATGGRIGYNAANPLLSGGTRYCFVVRAPIEITADCEYLEFHYDNKYFNATVLTDNTSNRELVGYAVEKIDASLTVPVTFGGNASASIAPGAHQISDKIYPAAFGLSKFTKGDRYFVRLKERVSGTGKLILSSFAAQVGTGVIAATQVRNEYYDEATESGVNIYSTGPIPTQPGKFTTGAAHPFPQAIVGKYKNVGELSVINVGDSIDWGFGDSQSQVPQITGTGHFDRANLDVNGKAIYSSMNAAIPGTNTTQTNVDMVNYYLQFANVLHHGDGVNDIGISGTPNLTTVYANMVSYWALARASGVKRIVKRGLLPVTTSAGGQWLNFADQTPNTRYALGSYGDQFEAQMQSYVGSEIDSFVRVKTGVADLSDEHIWLTDGVTNKLNTADGVHPNTNGTVNIAANGLLQAAILAQQEFI